MIESAKMDLNVHAGCQRIALETEGHWTRCFERSVAVLLRWVGRHFSLARLLIHMS